MAVQPGPTFKRYAANGAATVYTIPFLLLDPANLQITLNGVAVTSGFTLAGLGNASSSCTFTVAPAGDLLFQQVMQFQRLTDYQMNGDFLSQTVNGDYDRLWLAIKQLSRDDGRSLAVSPLEPEGIPALPVKALRNLKLLAFDAAGNPAPSNLTLVQLEQQPALAMASAAAAQASAGEASASEVLAGEAAIDADESAKAAAVESGKAAYSAQLAGIALGTARVFTTVEEGLLPENTVSGQYFSVPSADSNEYLILYLNNVGVAAEIKRYPSAAKLDHIVLSALEGYAYQFSDSFKKISAAIKDDGTFEIASLLAHLLSIGGALVFEDGLAPEYVLTVRDGFGNICAGIKWNGELVGFGSGGSEAVSSVERYGGVYSAQSNFLLGVGQSLMQGSNGQITTTQEYDNIGFAFGAASPSSTFPLTTTLTGFQGSQENPMYGAAGYIKELILDENELTPLVNDYQLLCGNVGSSGATIEEISKGGSRGRYELSLTQVQSGLNIANSEQKTYAFQAVMFVQGESNESSTKDDYKAKLKKLAEDYNTANRAITGKSNVVQFISYQLCRTGALNSVTPAQLEASEEVSYIHIATPTYFLDFYDVATHIDATSEKWLGGYLGLCYKRVLVDKLPWEPLKPEHHAVIGNAIDLRFNREGLVFDSVIVPTQLNQGFTVFDAAGSAVAITSVTIIKPNRVRIVCATPPQVGWRVKYGHQSVVGKATYNGPGGNLRDSQGDQLVYAAINKPMHNWCVIFNYEV